MRAPRVFPEWGESVVIDNSLIIFLLWWANVPYPVGNHRLEPGMPRKKILEVTPKQAEVYEILLNHVREFGFQPTTREIADLLGVQAPGIRERLAALVEKGFLEAPPHKTERRYGFPGVKFVAYLVDEDGNPREQTVRIGDREVKIGGAA
jgi:hypothetical protein